MSGSPAPQASIDDRELLAAHVRGDPDAFAHLVSRHRDRLWAVAVRTLGDHEDAADALQDALISALRNAAGFRGDAAVTTWLHRIVVNACLDRIRRRKTRPTVPLGTHDVAAPSDATGQVDTRLAVRAALASLPAEQREALILVDLEDLAVADAAHLLGVPIGTVKSRCSRGRTALAQLLAGTLHGTDIAGPAVAVPGSTPLIGNHGAPASVAPADPRGGRRSRRERDHDGSGARDRGER